MPVVKVIFFCSGLEFIEEDVGAGHGCGSSYEGEAELSAIAIEVDIFEVGVYCDEGGGGNDGDPATLLVSGVDDDGLCG